jgi:DNA-binding response OmpR family regulator
MARKILIVDDEDDGVQLLSFILTRAGFDVATAGNGVQTLSLLSEFRPDLVVLDVKLPDMDGYEVLGRIRERPGFASIPVIFSTADVSVRIGKYAREHRANGYLVKPFEADKLLAMIRNHLT